MLIAYSFFFLARNYDIHWYDIKYKDCSRDRLFHPRQSRHGKLQKLVNTKAQQGTIVDDSFSFLYTRHDSQTSSKVSEGVPEILIDIVRVSFVCLSLWFAISKLSDHGIRIGTRACEWWSTLARGIPAPDDILDVLCNKFNSNWNEWMGCGFVGNKVETKQRERKKTLDTRTRDKRDTLTNSKGQSRPFGPHF